MLCDRVALLIWLGGGAVILVLHFRRRGLSFSDVLETELFRPPPFNFKEWAVLAILFATTLWLDFGGLCD